ncbi:MAG TPA: terminase large subunit [Burkholderiaceae bacterium]|nr:terminase large subunit [Burkholderiaceae bacterium]HNB43863.1 terminase large subunit [Burkholderiaceae bacterium]HNG79518.1 terminase large subunit [Burkholderiaceae bacterium]
MNAPLAPALVAAAALDATAAAWPYLGRALAYARRVAEGAEVAGRYERLACERFLRDLARQGQPEFPYVLDPALGSRGCRFLELLPHIKGEWARPTYVDGKFTYATIRLEDWQLFQDLQVFGWVHPATRLRRFRRTYEEVARKNAKSTRAAGRMLYLLLADGEPGAHCYSAATTGEQAREVFDVARNMVLRSPELVARWGVECGKHDITVADLASSGKPLNAEGSTLDGLNIHFACVDELHAHKTRAVYDVLDSATGARSQPLISMITTAGSDRSGICYEQRDYTIKVLEGVVQDETWFGVIYTIDDGDAWHDPAVWRKANPNLGVSVKVDDMEAACRKALAQPSAVSNFLTKRLNVWVSSDTAWMDMQAWQRCADACMSVDDFAGEPCWIGLDLAEKRDFAALVKVFRRDDCWHIFPTLYLNEAAVAESGTAHLDGWARSGHVKVTPGNVTDFAVIADDLRAACSAHDVQEIDYDPAMSRYFATTLVEEGLPMVEIRQAPMFFTQPLLETENAVLENTLRHDGNPAMTWMISNVVVKVSKITGLKHPTKDRAENKIDGPVAMLLGLGRAMLNAGATEKSWWETADA